MELSPPPHRFSFETASLEQGVAHDGTRPILFSRVRSGNPDTSFNFVDLVVVPPGADIGVHTHAEDNEETYIVVSGRGVMAVDAEEFPVGPGDVVVNRPGGTHALCNNHDEPLRLIVIELKVGSA